MVGPVQRVASGGGRCVRNLLDQLPHGIARLCTDLEPAIDMILFDRNARRIKRRVVSADLIDKAAVARRARIRHHDPVEGFLFAAVAAQSDYQCHRISYSSSRSPFRASWIFLRRAWSVS